tara:strand:+ start:230 stop:475 length:246 start_codon:yes stop_codon:yes gene_type:complete
VGGNTIFVPLKVANSLNFRRVGTNRYLSGSQNFGSSRVSNSVNKFNSSRGLGSFDTRENFVGVRIHLVPRRWDYERYIGRR